jgi:hypothetical protein
MKEIQTKILILILIVIGVTIFLYKHFNLGLPLTPDKKFEIWNVEAKINVKVEPGPTKIQFTIPKDPYGYAIIDEDFVSGEYGQSIEDDGVNRNVIWAVRKSEGNDVLYYRIQLLKDPDLHLKRETPKIDYIEEPEYSEIEKTAIESILSEVRQSSADVITFTRELIKSLNNSNNENANILMNDINNDKEYVLKLIYILAGAHIPSRLIYLLELKDGARNADFIPYLEVSDGKEWIPIDPKTGSKGIKENMLIWKVGEDPVVKMKGGEINEISFSIIKSFKEIIALTQEKADITKSPFIEYSLLSLPINTQNIYRILIMLPLGALVVIFMRNLIGLETNGTFMPILIALSFRETHLIMGIILFVIIVALGLFFRFSLEKLKLLLIPRLGAVLTIVVMLMLFVSIVSHKLNIVSGLSVALFPMVIITMTIERSSIVWEERGAGEAIKQVIGSLIVATLGYLLMQNKLLEHLMFVFPELLLMILAIMIWMGRYTGYRLLELWRFRYLLIGNKQ